MSVLIRDGTAVTAGRALRADTCCRDGAITGAGATDGAMAGIVHAGSPRRPSARRPSARRPVTTLRVAR